MVWFTMNSPAVDLLHECEAEPCRGRIIALLLHVGRLLSEQNDIVAALDSLLDYMRREKAHCLTAAECLTVQAVDWITDLALGAIGLQPKPTWAVKNEK